MRLMVCLVLQTLAALHRYLGTGQRTGYAKAKVEHHLILLHYIKALARTECQRAVCPLYPTLYL